MKKTIKDLFIINNQASTLDRSTKLFYAIEKLLKKHDVGQLLQKAQTEKDDIMLEHALTGEKGALLFADTEAEAKQGLKYKHTKDQYRNMMEALNKHQEDFLAQEVEIEPHYLAKEDLPELTKDQIEAFKGFVIDENTLELSEPTGE